MFTLHETTRRGLCRLGFILLCVLPVCAIGGLTIWLSSDARRLEHQRELSEQLGLEVRLGHVQYTRPDRVRYENVEVADPETGKSIARVKSLEISRRDRSLACSAIEPELNAADLDALYEVVSRNLRLGKPGETLRATAKKLTLRMAEGSERVLDDVRGQFDFTASAAQAAVTFRAADRRSDEPITARVVRNRQTSPPSVGFEINTSSSALPCELIGAFLPAAVAFGSAGEFQGGIWAVDAADGWHGELAGQFMNVDLAALVGRLFPNQLSGAGQLTIERSRFSRGRIESVVGSLMANSGTIHRSLAATLIKELSLIGQKVGPTFGTNHPFNELALAFALDADGLLISGRCKSGPAGAVLVDPFGVAIKEPQPNQRQPLVSVAAFLATSNNVLMPFTSESAAIVGVLPLPGADRALETASPPNRDQRR